MFQVSRVKDTVCFGSPGWLSASRSLGHAVRVQFYKMRADFQHGHTHFKSSPTLGFHDSNFQNVPMKGRQQHTVASFAFPGGLIEIFWPLYAPCHYVSLLSVYMCVYKILYLDKTHLLYTLCVLRGIGNRGVGGFVCLFCFSLHLVTLQAVTLQDLAGMKYTISMSSAWWDYRNQTQLSIAF